VGPHIEDASPCRALPAFLGFCAISRVERIRCLGILGDEAQETTLRTAIALREIKRLADPS